MTLHQNGLKEKMPWNNGGKWFLAKTMVDDFMKLYERHLACFKNPESVIGCADLVTAVQGH